MGSHYFIFYLKFYFKIIFCNQLSKTHLIYLQINGIRYYQPNQSPDSLT